MWRYFFSKSKSGAVLLISDLIGFMLIFGFVHQQREGHWIDLTSIPLISVMTVTVIVMYIFDVYRTDTESLNLALPLRAVAAVALSGGIIAAVVYLLPGQSHAASRDSVLWRGVLFFGLFIFAIWASVSRVLLSSFVQRLQKDLRWLILGTGEYAYHIWCDFKNVQPRDKLQFFRINPLENRIDGEHTGSHVLEDIDSLDECLSRTWSGVVLATDRPLEEGLLRKLMGARLRGIRIYDLVDFYDKFLFKIPVFYLKDVWFVLSQGFDLLHHNMQLRIKRVMDFVLAGILLVVCMPLMIVIAILIRIDGPGPIIYSQMRTGASKKQFRVHKFRTMVKDAERNGAQWTAHNDSRITKVGRVLRTMRIDELPQMWNVLKGEMSFIGPRPERPDFNKDFAQKIPYYDLRHLVKPGITGWAQIQYPYGASLEDAKQKLEYDLYYIKNYSVFLDIAIAIKTMRLMLFRRGR
ncbi:MAG: sugar transferase [Gammaproteobacteria bacterium]|nr:sugar transferase [Gammaproteobacteria bacterium]